MSPVQPHFSGIVHTILVQRKSAAAHTPVSYGSKLITLPGELPSTGLAAIQKQQNDDKYMPANNYFSLSTLTEGCDVDLIFSPLNTWAPLCLWSPGHRGGHPPSSSVQSQLCPTLCDPMDHSTPGLFVHHQLPELPKLISIESVMPSSHLILCCPLLLLPSIPPSIRGFSNKSVLHIRWPKYWSFSFSISSFNEHSGLTSFTTKVTL